MKVAIIGRTQILYDTVLKLIDAGHSINVVVTAKASPEYTKKEGDFVKLCKSHKIPCFITPKLEGPALCRLLAGSDIGVSINWVSIMNQKDISYFKLGILNAHFGDLPRYRGNACPNWAIINGEKDVTVSMHFMEGGMLDCGKVILQER
jgi:methionyl-tRNA formyltransferase